MKGIAARIMYKSKGVHTIDNVWLKDADGEYRLSQDPGEVVAETEEFFFEWMRSRAKEWGTKEERRRFQFPERPKTHSDIPTMQWVGEKIEQILKRAEETEGKSEEENERAKMLHRRHIGLEEPFTDEELERYQASEERYCTRHIWSTNRNVVDSNARNENMASTPPSGNASWQTGPNSTTGFPATRGSEILYRPPGHQKGSFEAGRELWGGLSVPW